MIENRFTHIQLHPKGRCIRIVVVCVLSHSPSLRVVSSSFNSPPLLQTQFSCCCVNHDPGFPSCSEEGSIFPPQYCPIVSHFEVDVTPSGRIHSSSLPCLLFSGRNQLYSYSTKTAPPISDQRCSIALSPSSKIRQFQEAVSSMIHAPSSISPSVPLLPLRDG